MSPVFAHGQLRLYLLALLAEGPRHGYEIMRDLEQRFNGLYTPSAGTVYPRLAKLEEDGLVRRSDDGRKATYTLTDAGRAEIDSRQGDLGDLEQDLDRSVAQLADEVRSRVKGEAADLRAELKAAAQEARRTATPISGWGDWSGSGKADDADFERAINTLRQRARKVYRAKQATDDLKADVLQVIRDAQRLIDELGRR
ncbi:PadR family transcriptional regulator [Flexivirga sp. ID2601S]|uniref:PadR family transcriptional regulator n=1 Tax=Flexivirga aerilata TaxID=1656889 RepID=A0A849AFT6_9MICO|nr:PadR family transcriptional regulator [Flexivirga aerilata]NNG39279.1 PadR family transcriptional regulator [Flexivirga aerilata]